MSGFLPVGTLEAEMKLSHLLKGVGRLPQGGDREILGITHNSKMVQQGFLFVAIPGHQQDGRQFIPEAIQRGAAAIVGQNLPHSEASEVPQIAVDDSRKILAQLAARFYGEPSRALRLFGITGTNGKTTLTFLLESILKEAGRAPGVIGTINYRYGRTQLEAKTTTPESIDLQRLCFEMQQAHVTDVVMEVSSHSLSQGRVEEIHFDGAAFTNLSWDHLDYHRDLEDYFSAKLRLFTDYLPRSAKREKFAVVNMEDPRSVPLLQHCPVRKIRTGLHPPAEVRAASFQLSAEGIRATISVEGHPIDIQSALLGRFNLENILVAIGLAYGAGLPGEPIVRGIEKLRSVPGRMERIANHRGIDVFVDYAHTPDALARVGTLLKSLARGKMVTVFGCGGDRDRGKRAVMGQEATRFSDIVIVTSDNPRTEDPEKIIEEILVGLDKAGFPHRQRYQITDRSEAIHKAVELCQPGDLLWVAGKGHEDYQIIGTTKIHFSDQEILREFLA